MSEGLFGGWISEKSTSGGGSVAGNIQTLLLEYTYLSPAVTDFGTLIADDMIIETRVEVHTAFDDPAALLSIGPVSNPDSILSTTQTNANLACDYTSHEGLKITAADAMRFKITAGTSTQGAGRVIVIFRRA